MVPKITHFLVVHDKVLTLQLLRTVLHTHNYDLTESENGLQGLRFAKLLVSKWRYRLCSKPNGKTGLAAGARLEMHVLRPIRGASQASLRAYPVVQEGA